MKEYRFHSARGALKRALSQRRYRIAAWVLVTAFGVAVGLVAVWLISRSALSRKDEWAALQAAEYEYRSGASSNEPMMFENAYQSGVTVLGLPARDPSCSPQCPFIWLALNRADVDGGPMI